VGYESRNDANSAKEANQAPYNLMLTESADVRLDLPFRSLEDVAAIIAQALKDIGERLALP
jgi:hypothetical protein